MQTRPPEDFDYYEALAILEWQVELGADEAICEAPLDCYALPDKLESVRAPVAAPERGPKLVAPVAQQAEHVGPDPVQLARDTAGKAATLEALAEAMDGFDLCELKKGARQTVFADGNPKARLMIIGEAPGRDEDLQGKPFVGREGQLLDRMFGAIGLSRTAPDTEAALYLTNALPWRPPGNRDPEPGELAMMLPFLRRHVELVAPDVIVLMGNAACAAALNKSGILRLRGQWAEAFGKPCLPMAHPAHLLRNPAAKREAWADLLEIRARLNG